MANFSKQREGIYNDLLDRYDHPTADMVYASVREKQPHISLGTVYRNLSVLAESGMILKISTGNGPDRFDGHIKPHYHFICRECGEVSDLDFEPKERLNEEAAACFDGKIETHNLQFVGLCKDCLPHN